MPKSLLLKKMPYLCIVNQDNDRNVAQLVAHYVRDVGVGRSSRLIPTKQWSPKAPLFYLRWDVTTGRNPLNQL